MVPEVEEVGLEGAQEAVALAWVVPESEKEEQTVGAPAAGRKLWPCPHESPLCAASATASLLQSPLNPPHRHPLKIPPLPDPPQGFLDQPFAASWLEEASVPSCSSFSFLTSQAYLRTAHSDLPSFPRCCLAHYRHGA